MSDENCGTGRILIVEDNADVGEALFLMVKHFGYEPFLVTHGMAGVLAVDQLHPQAVLMDINLPDIDGCEAARRIYAKHAYLANKIIALTALGGAEDIQRTRAAGMRYHLVKPVHVDLLQVALESLNKPLH